MIKHKIILPIEYAQDYVQMLQIFDEHTKKLLLSITYQGPEMLLKKLPSDTKFIIKVFAN